MKTWKVEAAIIAVGMVLLGVIIKWGINDFIDKERIVSVKGLAEMEVPADKVIWPLMYKDIGNDPSLLYANMEQKNKAIVKFLESNGIAKEEISNAPPEVIDMQAERYGNRDIAYRYNATSVITVTSKNVDKVRKLMSEQAELLKQGIAISGGDYRYNVVYEFTGLNDVKPQMIEEATKNARAAAAPIPLPAPVMMMLRSEWDIALSLSRLNEKKYRNVLPGRKCVKMQFRSGGLS